MSRHGPGSPGSRPRAAGAVRRRQAAGGRGDGGAITVEAALVIPSLVLVTALLVALVSLVGVRLEVIDASREAARLVARGDNVAHAEDTARQIAGPDAVVRVDIDADQVRVHVEAPALAHRPSGVLGVVLSPAADLVIGADSVAAREVVP